MRCARAIFESIDLADGMEVEIAELMQCKEVKWWVTTVRQVLRKEKLGRTAKRAAVLLEKVERKAFKYPVPHGYGDGFSECACKRCVRGASYEEAAEKALTAWEEAVRQSPLLATWPHEILLRECVRLPTYCTN